MSALAAVATGLSLARLYCARSWSKSSCITSGHRRQISRTVFMPTATTSGLARSCTNWLTSCFNRGSSASGGTSSWHAVAARRQELGDVALVRLHVPLQERVQVEQVQSVQTHDARQHRYEKHLRFERERRSHLQPVKQTLGEGLRVVHQRHRREPRFAARAVFFFVRSAYGSHLAFQLLLFLLLRAGHACVFYEKANSTYVVVPGKGKESATNLKREDAKASRRERNSKKNENDAPRVFSRVAAASEILVIECRHRQPRE